MRELFEAAIGVASRRRREVLLVAVGLLLPVALLSQVPAWRGSALDIIGGGLDFAASLVLIAVFLADLRHAPLSTLKVSSILRAYVRVFLAFGIAAVIAIPIGLAVVLAARWQQAVPYSFAFESLLIPVFVFFAPIYLLEPVCLSEPGGPRWSLKRAWALSRPRRGQIRVLVGGIWILTAASGALRCVAGFAPLATLIALIVALTIIEAALLAVFYDRLVAEEPPAPPAPRLIRAPVQAAAGTIRATKRRHGRPRPDHGRRG
jgi:hypothetical protein